MPRWTVAHVVDALVVSSIRYCISVYGTCSRTQLHRVQKLLNFCARVISGRRKFEHISDVLRQLGWLTAVQLVDYHRLCLVRSVLDTQCALCILPYSSFITCVFYHLRLLSLLSFIMHELTKGLNSHYFICGCPEYTYRIVS